MNRYILFLFTLITCVSFRVGADTPTFDNLSDEDFDTIAKDFSGMLIHTSATPPTSLGKIFGVEAAVIAGAARVPGIESISRRYDPNVDIPFAPFAMLYGAVSVPKGFTIETNLLPETKVEGLRLRHVGIGVKWSVTDVYFSNLPFDLAIKTYFSRSEIGFGQSVSNGGPSMNVDVDFENNMHGAELLFGVDALVVQPYVGAGYVASRSDLRGVAAADPTYSMFVDNMSESKSTSVNSVRLIAGCQFNLALLKTSLEYNKVFGNDRVAAKIGFAF